MLLRLLKNREARIVITFAFVGGAGGLLANRIVTQAISPQVLGEFYLLMNLVFWVTLPTASAYVYVYRHWAVARTHGLTQRFVVGLFKALLAQILIAAVVCSAYRILSGNEITWGTAILLAITSIAQAILQGAGPIPGAERRRVTAGIFDLLGNPVRQMILGCAGLALGLQTATQLLTVQALYCLAVACVLAAGVWVFARSQRDAQSASPEAMRQLSLSAVVSYSIPYGISAAIAQVCASAERWGLARRENAAATALFVQATALSLAVVTAVTGIVNTYYYPIISQIAAQTPDPFTAAKAVIRRYLLISSGALALIAIFTALLSAFITPILFGPKFSAVANLLPWSMLGASFFGMASALSVFSYVARETVSINVARGVSQAFYALCLLLASPRLDMALIFSKLFGVANLFYFVLMIMAAAWVRRCRARSRSEFGLP
jgi:O-antigen/teichoic acid export membrane protein